MSDSVSIAVIGIACRFPGADTKEAFWKNLAAGQESVTFFSDTELRRSGISEETLADENYVRARAVLEDCEYFDFETFGYLQKEAAAMDPQQRVLLENAWLALEDAGYGRRKHEVPVGVYVCANQPSYLEDLYRQRTRFDESLQPLLAIGNCLDFLASRISYKLNLQGPAIVAQTACSSSLACVHLACQGLLFGDCDMAIAGGVSIGIPQNSGYRFHEEGILSPDGHCRSLDLRARGTVPGHGAGLLVLKRLEDAVQAGDQIYAVIRGSAINNDGGNRVGFVGPSPDGQAGVLERALRAADVGPESVGFVEAHGSGTAVGDAIELAALVQVYGKKKRQRQCVLGSIKSNLGHLGPAAGIAGLIKTILCLKHGRHVPSLHFETPAASLALTDCPFRVSTRTEEWLVAAGEKRIAGVSSFGMGGSNCHLIVEESPALPPRREAASAGCVFLLSARTATALETMSSNLAKMLRESPEIELQDVAFTLRTGRELFPWRRAVVGLNRQQVCDDLSSRNPGAVFTVYRKEKRQQPSFLISGMGEEYPEMGRQLYGAEPVFREWIDACTEHSKGMLQADLRELLFQSVRSKSPAVSQPVQFAFNYALAKLWMSKGVMPKALLGYSLGEYVAASLAGVFRLEDAMKIVAHRSALIESVSRGAMIAVGLSADSLRPLLKTPVSLAAENGFEMSVASGPPDLIADLEKYFAENRIAWRRVSVERAVHSAMMEPVRNELVECIAKMPRFAPKIPVVSNVSGSWLSNEQAVDPDYWGRHLCSPVLFFQGVKVLCTSGNPLLVEIGPSNTLSSIAAFTLASEVEGDPFIAPSLASGKGFEIQSFYSALARLEMMGVELSAGESSGAARARRVSLPGYPFERWKCVIEPTEQPVAVGMQSAAEAQPKADPKRNSHDKNRVFRPRPVLKTAYAPPAGELNSLLVEAWERFFGISPIGIHDDFFDLGGNSLLAVQLVNFLHRNQGFHLTIRSIFQHPTIARLAASIAVRNEERFEMGLFLNAVSRGDTAGQETLLQNYVASQVREIIGRDISPDEEFTPDHLQELVPHLTSSTGRDLDLPLYPHEVAGNNSGRRLVAYLQNELARKFSPASHHAHPLLVSSMLDRMLAESRALLDSHQPSAPISREPIAFVLSAARSGTALLHEMLRLHPRIVSAIELQLLRSRSLKECQSEMPAGRFGEGLQSALRQLFGFTPEAAQQLLSDWLEQELSTEEVYRRLQEKARPRCFVEISTAYAGSMEALLRAEDLFACPKYVYVSCHPYSAIESYMRHRVHAIDGNRLGGGHPYAAAEYHWALCNQHIQWFLKARPPRARVHQLKYEDLLRDPLLECGRLCQFLEIPFDQVMLEPLRTAAPGGISRRNGGAFEMALDPANAWQSIHLPSPLGPVASRVAQELNYDLSGVQ